MKGRYKKARLHDAPDDARGQELARDAGSGAAYDARFDAGYKEGYDAGFDAGYGAGHSKGYGDGYNQGYDKGYEAAYAPAYDSGYDEGFRKGYDDGYAKAWDTAFDKAYDSSYGAGYHHGFKAGYLDGASEVGMVAAEEAIASLLPENQILPQYSAEEIIRRGLATVSDQVVPILSGKEVALRIKRALDRREPLSIVRLGDGEALTLAQDVVLDADEILKRAPWLSHAGVDVPDTAARAALKESILRAHIVGVPTSRIRNHQPLLFKAFEALGIEWSGLALTHAVINYIVHKEGHLKAAVGDRRLLLVGNLAGELQDVLVQAGANVVGAVAPVSGVRDVDRVMAEVRAFEFDIAFVAAGVAAVILAERIATEMGKVALDFGHLADELVYGQAKWE